MAMLSRWKSSMVATVAMLSVTTMSGSALAASLTPAPKTTTITKTTATVAKPTLAVSQPGPGGIANVDSLDKIARTKQLALETVMTKPNATTGEWLTAATAATRAELDLDQARNQAWDAVMLSPANAVLINQPLTLAMLDLHIEVRRAVGATFHTVVPGLVSDHGCQGDLVAERLIYRYGATAAVPQGDATADIDALARQVACLGAAQVAELEKALADGFADVRGRMEQRNLNGMVPSFARLVAPVQVLVLDVRKHRAAASLTWQWFSENGKAIEQNVALAGWPTGTLLLWNRRQGGLVSYAACPAGKVQPGCVDFIAFLRSLQDPRALAMGDCAFAGMINRGIEPLKGGDRYTCPSLDCEASASATSPTSTTKITSTTTVASGVPPKGGLDTGKRQKLSGLWPQLTATDLSAMGGTCRMAGADMQGGNVLNTLQCAGGTDTNPFEQHAACIVDAIGAGNPPQIGGELQGVPMGSDCKLAEGGSGTPQTPAPKAEEPKTEDDKPWYEKLRDLFTTSSGTATSTGTAKPEPKATPAPQTRPLEEGDEWELSDQKTGTNIQATALYDKQTKDFVRFRVEVRGTLKDAVDLAAFWAMEDGDPMIGLLSDQLDEMARKQQDCADPMACTNTCTAMGQMISAVQACTDDLLGALATALGKPDKSKIVKRLDIVSYPNPDADRPGEETDGGMCTTPDLSGGTPARQPVACGLILCADSLAASVGGSGCSCRGNTAVYLPADICTVARCADGTVPDSQCQCRDTGGYQPGRPPVPPINSITTSIEVRGGLLTTTTADGAMTRVIDLGGGVPSRGF